MNETIKYKPIGIIHTPFKHSKGTPIQASGAKETKGKIEVFSDFEKGLKDLNGFSHIILLYHFHLSKKPELLQTPFLDDEPHGVFAIRSPSRPNSIGLSVVRLDKIEKNIIYISDIDIVDGTPLLDIKPYISKFDLRKNTKSGWLDKTAAKISATKDDGRFSR